MEVYEQGQTHSFFIHETLRFNAKSKESLPEHPFTKKYCQKSCYVYFEMEPVYQLCYGLDERGSRVLFQEGRYFSFPCLVQTKCGVQTAAYIMHAGHFSLEIKRPEPDALDDHLMPSLRIVELNLSPSIYLRGVVLN